MSDEGDGVRALLAAYGARIDAGDFEGVGALFTEGVLATEDGVELARGADAVAAFYRSIVVLHDGSPRTKHLVLGTWLEPADDGVVVARSSYLVLQDLDGTLVPLVTGGYVDRVARGEDGTWGFVERRISVELAGDLGRHLTISL